MSNTNSSAAHPPLTGNDVRGLATSILNFTAADQPSTERDERLRGIQERAARATVAPWTAEEFNDYPGDEGTPIVGGGELGSMEGHLVAYAMTYGTGPGGYDPERCDADAAFIAAARVDVPWLLAEVARLDRIINGYDRTPAEQRAADAEARVARLDAVATAVRDMHQPKIRTISVPVFDQWDSPTQVQHGCYCGHYAYPCPTVLAMGIDS